MEVEWSESIADGASAPHRPRRPIEGGEEPVACRVDLAAPEALELLADDLVMLRESLAPAAVAEFRRLVGGAHDIVDDGIAVAAPRQVVTAGQ